MATFFIVSSLAYAFTYMMVYIGFRETMLLYRDGVPQTIFRDSVVGAIVIYLMVFGAVVLKGV